MVQNMLETINERLAKVWTERSAPDDVVEFATSMTLAVDGEADEFIPNLVVFVALRSPEIGPYASTTLLLMIPLRVVNTEAMYDHIANQMWDRLQSKRIAITLGLDDGSEETLDNFGDLGTSLDGLG